MKYYGMLWRMSEDKNKTLPDKVQEALDYFNKKYSPPPTKILLSGDYASQVCYIPMCEVEDTLFADMIWIGNDVENIRVK
jgi:hypothetical protein